MHRKNAGRQIRMAVTLNLWSCKVGEIKRFLERYHEKDIKMDEDVGQWVYVYKKPLDAIDMISAIIDNVDKYQLALSIQVNEGEHHPITLENHNDVIKGLLCLFYEETPASAYCE
jgi:hypothetical protein